MEAVLQEQQVLGLQVAQPLLRDQLTPTHLHSDFSGQRLTQK